MSVDKFGRYSNSFNSPAVKGPRGSKGEGFNLNHNGDFDIQNKKLCNVGLATETADAVNLITLKNVMAQCLLRNDKDEYNVNGYKVINLPEPKEEGDPVNKKYFNNNSPIKLIDSYSFHQFRIQDVSYPISGGDVVNYDTLKSKAIVFDTGLKSFNAKNNRIVNVADPIDRLDCVNLNYFNKHALKFNTAKEFDVSGHVIKNVGFPRKGGDAINYNFLSNIFAEMSYAIYNNIHNKTKTKILKEEWKKKVTKGLYTCDWEGLFGKSENAIVPLSDSLANKPLNDDSNPLLNEKDELETESNVSPEITVLNKAEDNIIDQL